jgi:uncharacterized protein YecE (DUF72 family)
VITDAPHRLAAAGILIGTCSWTDPTLTGTDAFYPDTAMSAEERLRYYATAFPIVEVDATYYAPPSERTAGYWVERTPKDFVFDVKAYRLLTEHPTPPSSLWKDLRSRVPEELAGKRNVYARDLPGDLVEEAFSRFAEALLPLHSAGKLGSVLFQLPPYVYPSRVSFGILERAARLLGEYRVAVEFRQERWMDEAHRDETLSFLEDHGLVFVGVDAPQGFPSSMPPVAAATVDDLAEVRFHGRNAENWEKRGISAAERFRYDYTRADLEEWVPRIAALRAEGRRLHLLMNNCYADYGIRSARLLADLLAAAV